MSRKITIIIEDEPYYGKPPPDWWFEQQKEQRQREQIHNDNDQMPQDWMQRLSDLRPSKAV